MEFDVTFYALAIPAAFIAGVAKGGFGGGAAFVATAILALVIPPVTALGIMLPLLMIVDAATLRPFWKQWDTRSSVALMVGGLPGIIIGWLLYKATNADVLRILIGLISLGFVAFQLTRSTGLLNIKNRLFSWKFGISAGVIAGFTSFVSHAGGPPAAMFLLSQGMGKTAYHATTVFAFWVINAMKAVPYAFLGVFTYETMIADLIMAPAALIGAAFGVYAHHVVPERAFFALTYVLLVGTGTKLIFDGLT
ncbi:MAG: sulfite exporter TauE/SafE family protein [Litoreibacter sp.]